MKIKNILILLILAIAISSCKINLNPNFGAVDPDKIIESTKVYCEDYEACKVNVDSNVKVENYDIYNTYTTAYSKVKEVSLAVLGYNYSSTNADELILSAYYSGFIFDKKLKDASSYEYYVLTTALDFQNLPYYEVSLHDGTAIEANLKGIYNDANYHISVFTFEFNKNISLTEIDFNKEVNVGEEILTMSSPSISVTLKNTMTRGIVSGIDRLVETGVEISSLGFQFDAPINPGSQGGAVFDENGKIFGMISGKINSSSSVYIESIGIANNLKDIKNIVDHLKNGESYVKPSIGVSVIDYSLVTLVGKNYYLYPLSSKVYDISAVNEQQEASKMELPNDVYSGIYISKIISGSSAANAGVCAGDIITRVDDVEVMDNASLALYLYTKNKGDTIKLYTYLNPQGYTINL